MSHVIVDENTAVNALHHHNIRFFTTITLYSSSLKLKANNLLRHSTPVLPTLAQKRAIQTIELVIYSLIARLMVQV